MNIAVVDDLAADRTRAMDAIKKYAKENAIRICLTEYESGELFLEQIATVQPDAVFLDIYMDGVSGMDTAREIRKRYPSCRIVFVTTSAAFAVESYEVEAFHYILKPYTDEMIAGVLRKLSGTLQTANRFIKVKEGREWNKILIRDILYADYNNHYVRIHTESAIISTYIKFQEIEEMLLVYPFFLSCYRCIVVNMNQIKKIDGLFFLLGNGEYIPINRKRVKEIKACYMDYIFGMIEEGKDHDD